MVAGGAKGVGGLQVITAVMPAFATGTKPRLDGKLALDGGGDDVGLELGVGLHIRKGSATIGTSRDLDRDNLIDLLGFGAVGSRMVVGSARSFGRTILELVIVFAERVSGAFVFPLVLGALFLKEVTFGSKLLVVEFE